MYIKNTDKIPENHKYKCKKQISDWLQSKNIPLLGQDGEYFIFSKTDLLEKTIKDIPFWLRIYA